MSFIVSFSFVNCYFYTVKKEDELKKWVYILFFLFLAVSAGGQVVLIPPELPDSLAGRGDSIPHVELQPIQVKPHSRRYYRRKQRRYSRLVSIVNKVYPMAKLAAKKLEEYNKVYLTLKTERQRKKYIKQIQEDLMNEYGDEIKHMKISEGRVLMKLIDRETGHSSYAIIKEFRGGFTAFFWQTVARLFGNDLKVRYNPYGEDWMIENIVQQIDQGAI
ncbi:DUF4294 domain-containing protein [Prolixibacter sp. SD074]|jgi:hypothetical protein|uniref:DUF4294 domain-containing protein n=1 Tax=Prolixibacter sp. SD074 TaxID=2652391 RepID=UPI0012990E75|nr:DUF4294 domain-containing protein [Prolixibacter sp. SD074]